MYLNVVMYCQQHTVLKQTVTVKVGLQDQLTITVPVAGGELHHLVEWLPHAFVSLLVTSGPASPRLATVMALYSKHRLNTREEKDQSLFARQASVRHAAPMGVWSQHGRIRDTKMHS